MSEIVKRLILAQNLDLPHSPHRELFTQAAVAIIELEMEVRDLKQELLRLHIQQAKS